MKKYDSFLNAEDRIREIELRRFHEVCSELAKCSGRLLGTAHALAELDVFSALAKSAALGGYVRPEVRDDNGLDIRDGRHPVIKQILLVSGMFQTILPLNQAK